MFIKNQITAVLQWFKNRPLFNKLLKNASKLLSGDLAASMLSFVSVALTARALGPEIYGIFVLIQAYTSIVDKLVNFQSWQALIKYGADSLENDKIQQFKRLIKFGTILDSGTALLGAAVAISGAYIIGAWKGWEPEIIVMIIVYSSTILFNLSGTPTAILRLFDKFGLFAIQRIAAAVIKLAGVLIVYFLGLGLWGFIIAYVTTIVFGYLILLIMGWKELGMHNVTNVFKAKTDGLANSFQGIWSYVWTTNLNGSIRMAATRLDTVLVGAVLGTVGAGIYEIVKKFSGIVSKLSNPLYQAIYPELAKLWSKAKKREMIKLALHSAFFAGGIGLIIWAAFLLLGDWIIYLTVGPEYSGAYPVLIWYLLGVVISIFGFPLQPIMLAMGYPERSFYVHLVTTILYFAALYLLLHYTGLIGAGVACIIYYVSWSFLMIYIEFKMLSRNGNIS